MPPTTGTDVATAQGSKPEEVLHSLEKILNPILKKGQITINDAGNNYAVNEMRNGFFYVAQLDKAGKVLTGSAAQFPCDDHYLGLVLIAWRGI